MASTLLMVESMLNRLQLPITIFALASAFTACGGGSPGDELSSLSAANGGYDTGDEAPMFGDSSFGVLAEDRADPAPSDDLSRDDARDPGDMVRLDRIASTVIWGHRRANRDDQDWTDWSGRLAVNGGAIMGVRTLRFDERDHLLPRESRDAVAWVSHTRPHHDGIQTAIAVRPDSVVPGSVVLETVPFQIEIPLAELAHYERVFDVGDEQVAIHAFRIRPDDCASGALRGAWSAPNEDGIGRIHGRIFDETGRLRGHLRGRYGTRDDGEQVFFAKVITAEGRFVGRLRGRWGEGAFRGHFEGRGGARGLVRGHYMRAEDPASAERANGIFTGRWAEVCRDRPTTMPSGDMPPDDQGDPNAPPAEEEAAETPLVP